MPTLSLATPSPHPRFTAMVGTGGIGAGSLFLLDGNHTLGREESRSGNFLDARDYCKLHIISHYVKVLAGPSFPVFPIGKLGDDDVGRTLFNEMRHVGLDTGYVRVSPCDKTLFSFCFVYPDGSGGNMTTGQSACSKVDEAFIEEASDVFARFAGKFVALAAAEVPLAARKKLLALSERHGGFGAASFTSGEIAEARKMDMFGLVGLLAVNLDEAAAIANLQGKSGDPRAIIEGAIAEMQKFNPSICLSITAGKDGSWSWDGEKLSFRPVFPVQAKSAAGAGDAHIAAVIYGLAAGLSLSQAQTLGNLAAAFSVTSPHTIHPGLNRQALRQLALRSCIAPDPGILRLL